MKATPAPSSTRGSLDGPSKTITVEPVRPPVPVPPPSIKPEPQREPSREPERPKEPVP